MAQAYYNTSSTGTNFVELTADMFGAIPDTGGDCTGYINFPSGYGLKGKQKTTSSYTNCIIWYTDETPAGSESCIGRHNTGGDSTNPGAIILVPYETTADPWNKTAGLYIAKNTLLLEGKPVVTQQNPEIVVSSSQPTNSNAKLWVKV